MDKSRGNLHASQPRGKWWYATNSWWGTSRRPVDGSRSSLEKPAARRSSPCAAICGSEWNLGTTNIVLFGDGRNLVRGSEKKLLATIIWGLWNKSYRYAQANTNWGWTKPFLIRSREQFLPRSQKHATLEATTASLHSTMRCTLPMAVAGSKAGLHTQSLADGQKSINTDLYTNYKDSNYGMDAYPICYVLIIHICWLALRQGTLLSRNPTINGTSTYPLK